MLYSACDFEQLYWFCGYVIMSAIFSVVHSVKHVIHIYGKQLTIFIQLYRINSRVHYMQW